MASDSAVVMIQLKIDHLAYKTLAGLVLNFLHPCRSDWYLLGSE